MNLCFADTSYFLALLIPEDVNHAEASEVAQRLRRPVITSDYVVLEVANHLSGLSIRRKFDTFIRSLRQDPYMIVLPASVELMEGGIGMYLDRADKAWSLTDCISFLIMQKRGIVDALTTDHHFTQAGFHVLLKTNL